jgi:DNA-binding response OmpR family regulator
VHQLLSSLTPREVAVLTVFLEAGGRVVSRRELMRRSGLREASPRRVDAVIVSLRRKLGEDAVRTVRGRGWMLVPGTSEVETAVSPQETLR